MTDKEVGELWRETELFGSDYTENGYPRRSAHLKGKLRETIRKLVEERYSRSLKTLPEVLASFGIPEEDWE